MTLAGARFLVATMTNQDVRIEGSVFEAPDGMRYILKTAGTLADAEAIAAASGATLTVFAVRPYWGMPAKEWIEADRSSGNRTR